MLKRSIACRVGRFMAVVEALIAVALTLTLSRTLTLALAPAAKSIAGASTPSGAPSGGAPNDSAKSMQSGRWQRYGLTGTNLQDVDLVSPADGWVVGTDGLLAHWDGHDWQVYENLELGTRNINEIEMLASDQAWAVVVRLPS